MHRSVKAVRKANSETSIKINNHPALSKRKFKRENEVKQKAMSKKCKENHHETTNSCGSKMEIITISQDSDDENLSNSEEEEEEEEEDRRRTDHGQNNSKEIVAGEREAEIPRSKIKKRKTKYNPAEEARLEKLVFGDAGDVMKNFLSHDESAAITDATRARQSLNTRTNESDQDDLCPGTIDQAEADDCFPIDETIKTVAWIDENDTSYSIATALKSQRRRLPKGRREKMYTELLENKFTQMVGTPEWAMLDHGVKNTDDDDSDTEISRRSNHLAVSMTKKLAKGTIDIKVLTDINKSTHTEGPIVTSVEFHPTSTVAMVAGSSGVLSLFQIDGRENTKLQSIRFEKFHINCAKFLHQGNEAILGSRNSWHSQAYDLMSGKTYRIPLPRGVTNMQKFEISPDGKFIAVIGKRGVIHLLSSSTKELVTNFKMNRRCLAMAFCPNSEKLVTHGDGEEMYIWDLKSRSCVHRAADDGCIAGSAITFSPSGQFMATGSNQGVVNIYDADTVMQEKYPKPLKIVLNLVTPISKLKFNPTSEILAMASKFKENAFKMLHLPTFTVFSNFPTYQTKMFHPLNIDFSPGSGYLGLTNDKGYAYLYRLKHYYNY